MSTPGMTRRHDVVVSGEGAAGPLPRTCYASSGDVHLAYQVVGDGPIDVVLVDWLNHLEHTWEEPHYSRFFRRLARFSRLIRFDRRGTGLSDRVTEPATLEQRVDDLRAVMDAAHSESACLFGLNEGGALAALLAAMEPTRVSSLVLYGAYARRRADDDYPWGMSPEQVDAVTEEIANNWGGGFDFSQLAPSMVGNQAFADWFDRHNRLALSPGGALAVWQMTVDFDIRPILPLVRVPTLVLHRRGDRRIPVGHGRYLADHIPGAKYVELEGDDHLPYIGDSGGIVDEVEEFVTGSRSGPDADCVLATVLFTDIVGSTAHASALGDRAWRERLDAHDEMVRRELRLSRGREIKTMGDGFLAVFDGPARAVRCALAITQAARGLDLEVRAGVHIGEVELRGTDVGGLAVNIASRITAHAAGGEVVASRAVTDLVAGSGITFRDRGDHELKGVPGNWRLYVADS